MYAECSLPPLQIVTIMPFVMNMKAIPSPLKEKIIIIMIMGKYIIKSSHGANIRFFDVSKAHERVEKKGTY